MSGGVRVNDSSRPFAVRSIVEGKLIDYSQYSTETIRVLFIREQQRDRGGTD